MKLGHEEDKRAAKLAELRGIKLRSSDTTPGAHSITLKCALLWKK